MDKPSTLFSFCVGGLALVSTAVSLALYLRSYLPSAQIKVLDALFDETNGMFEKAIVDGLLPNQTFQNRVRVRLTKINNARECLREAAFQATTSLDDIKALLRGVSTEIINVTSELKKLRRCIITTSQMQRVRRLRQDVEAAIPVTEPASSGHILGSTVNPENSTLTTNPISSDHPYELPSRRLTEPSSAVSTLQFDSFSFFNTSRHGTAQCSLCCSDITGSHCSPSERSLSSRIQDQLSSSTDVCDMSAEDHGGPRWPLRCWRFLAGSWTSKTPCRDSNGDSRNNQLSPSQLPPSSDLEPLGSSLTLLNEHTRLPLSFSSSSRGGGCASLPKSYSTPDLGSEIHRSPWDFFGWKHLLQRGPDTIPVRNSVPV